jgi:hypothetical protein
MGVLLAVVAGMIALGTPASALDCGGVEVERVDEESSRFLTPGNQDLQLVHATTTYTVEGESRPFFRFVSSWVERGYQNQDDEHISARSGRDEGFSGRIFSNDSTGELVTHGRETLPPDDLACEVLSG